ncbi:hypothetical protein ACA910_005957 [Epithemia clementina (nom. ined.)]
MSNAYGFDFLRTEHLDESAQHDIKKPSSTLQDEPGTPSTLVLSEEALQEIQNKPDLEKQFLILSFLQKHRGSGCLAPNVIYKSTGIDLDLDTKVGEMLQKNPKVKVEMVPDPENPALLVATYAYQAKYSTVRDRTTLLAQINRMLSGVPMRDLEDSYPKVEDDLAALITAGDVVAVANTEDKDKILFPRGEAFLVELDGIVTVPQKKLEGGREQEIVLIDTDVDPTTQIRRGEAVQVGGEWFRVSSAVRAATQPSRALAPLSVVSSQDMNKRNEVDGYSRQFNSKTIPLDSALSTQGIANLQQAKEARERLAKLAHGGRISSGGGGGSLGVLVGQALGSLAHSSNPTALAGAAAASGSVSSASSSGRRRQNRTTVGGPNNPQSGGGATKEEIIKAASDVALATFSHARRHGCTKDIREMYLATSSLVPKSDNELQAKLVEHKLLQPGETMRRPRLKKRGAGTNLDNDGKPKKRRYYERKSQRMTNVHLDGTPEGSILALALEQQRQGKSVGDGGM